MTRNKDMLRFCIIMAHRKWFRVSYLSYPLFLIVVDFEKKDFYIMECISEVKLSGWPIYSLRALTILIDYLPNSGMMKYGDNALNVETQIFRRKSFTLNYIKHLKKRRMRGNWNGKLGTRGSSYSFPQTSDSVQTYNKSYCFL